MQDWDCECVGDFGEHVDDSGDCTIGIASSEKSRTNKRGDALRSFGDIGGERAKRPRLMRAKLSAAEAAS